MPFRRRRAVRPAPRGRPPGGPAAAALVLALAATGCMTWKARTDGVPRALAERPDRVQVVFADGTRAEYHHPTIVGDSLVGLRDGRRAAAPLERVPWVEVQKVSVGRTALLVGAG